tara:strand:- start:48 stop:266 length:219 start_codon:yes stop_codon:yes gene_type:complete
MTDEMKLKIAKLEADGYKVEVITNYNTDKWGVYIESYRACVKEYYCFGFTPPPPQHPSSFFTTEFKVTKGDS